MKTIIIAILLLGKPLIACSQTVTYDGGGYGHFMMGPSWLQSYTLTDYIMEAPVLGMDAEANRMSMMVGGEGFAIVGRFIVGGGGMAMEGVTWRSYKGNATVSSGAGYFKTGYCIITNTRQFLVTGLAIGGSNTGIELSNTSNDASIAFDPRSPVESGDTGGYSLNSLFLEPFAAWKLFTIAGNDASGVGGMLVGIDAGCSMLLASGNWQDREMDIAADIPTPAIICYPFIRITIGGGGVGYHVNTSN